MKLSFVTIYVKNMETSLAFYQDVLGLKITRRFAAGPESEIAFLKDEGAEVELIYEKSDEPINYCEKMSMGFEVESATQKIEELKQKGIPIVKGPFQPNPTTTIFFINDPDGVSIEFIEQ